MTDVETGGIRMNSSEEDPIDAVMWDDDIDLGILLDMDDGLHSSPALSIGEIEKILLNDDVQDDEPAAAGDGDDFFSGCFLLDSPLPSSSTTAVSSDNHASPDIASLQQPQPPSEAEEEAVKDSSEPSPSLSPEEEREGEEEEDNDDPLTKKRKRQMRNRDAAVRSRERKKMYVKDLEAKSKYFESECRRLGMVLQCVMAENHSLRLAMYNNRAAYGASTTRQESAVLFLESLLLGSLLWLVGEVMGLLLLPGPILEVRRPGKNPGLESRRREAPSEALQLHWSESYMMSKGCRGSRRKMRMMCAMPAVILLRS